MNATKTFSKKFMLTKNTGNYSKDKSNSNLNVLRRFKSQETYSATTSKVKPKEIPANEITNQTNKTNLNEFSSLSKSKELPKSNYSKVAKTDSSTSKNEADKMKSKMNNYVTNNPRNNIKEPAMISKIIKDESIQELNTEENINSQEEYEDDLAVDEMKSSEIVSDFYTNSIGEASESVVHVRKNIINNLPIPFVSSMKNKFKEARKESPEKARILSRSPKKKFNSGNKEEIQQKLEQKANENVIQMIPNENSQKNRQNKNDKIVENVKNDICLMEKPSESNLKGLEDLIKLNNENTENNQNNYIINADKNPKNIDEVSKTLDNLQRKLLISAKKGDRDLFIETLENVLNNQGNVDYSDESGWTALHYACDEGNLKIVDILINTNCDVNAKTQTKKSPLHLACSHGYFDISKLLIESGAVMNSLDHEKNSPLHICCQVGHLELLKYILDKLPQAESKNIYNKTPFELCKKEEMKLIISEYLRKNESKFHKVQIHTTNNKSANVLIKNMGASKNMNEVRKKIINGNKTPNSKELTKTPVKTPNPLANSTPNTNYNLGKNKTGMHNKYQSSTEFNDKMTSAFQNNNNININISTNIADINSPNHNIKVFNLNKDGSNNKLKVTVETKLNSKPLQSQREEKNSLNNSNNCLTEKSSKNLLNVRNSLKQTNTVLKFSNNQNKFFANKSHTTTLKLENNTSRNVVRPGKIGDFSPNNLSDNVIDQEKSRRLTTTTNREKSINRINLTNEKSLYKALNTLEESSLNKNEEQHGPPVEEPSETQIKDSDLENTHEEMTNDHCTLNSEEERIGPSAFVCHALLGKGSFGEVYLVEKNSTGVLYAMKVLSKDKITGQNLVKYAMTERNVLSLTNHPFIVKLNFSFQTSDKLFLILDYCPGGDLAEHLARENRFSEERAKIYICEIILALEDLHKRDIIFRDLKPDNVVIDTEGHALLTDFGLSKEGVFDSKSAKSFCGSIAYLAPEMLKRVGHGKAVDWYLLGVLFYEMLVGIPPYFTNNKEQLFRNIEKAELQIPKFVREEPASLLRELLQRDPLKRLGTYKDAEEIKNHKYFSKVNWNDVYLRKLKPPVPVYTNRVLQKFNRPRLFEDDQPIMSMNSNMDLHFDGWSFINTENHEISCNNINNLTK